MDNINHILIELKNNSKKKEKERILRENKTNNILHKILFYTYNPYYVFHVIKIPKVSKRLSEEKQRNIFEQWNSFFLILDKLRNREITGNSAINEVHTFFSMCSEENERWMRKVLEKHLNVGITSKTINKVYDNILPTFEVQLSEKYNSKRVANVDIVAVEPKKDGNRCLAIVENNTCKLFSRNGKVIDQEKFKETIVSDLVQLENGMYDGELFGKNFREVMTQVRRKGGDINVTGIKFHIWDYMPVEDWVKQKTNITCKEAREYLESLNINKRFKHISLIRRDLINPVNIESYMIKYFNEGLTDEGIMIKKLDTCYKFGRGHNVMKHKTFHEEDLMVCGFEDGKKGSKNENNLGAIVVNFNGVNVKVGSGFDDEERKEVYNNKGKYMGKIVQVKYQSVTDDGSLRHPVFVCWRPDKEER